MSLEYHQHNILVVSGSGIDGLTDNLTLINTEGDNIVDTRVVLPLSFSFFRPFFVSQIGNPFSSWSSICLSVGHLDKKKARALQDAN